MAIKEIPKIAPRFFLKKVLDFLSFYCYVVTMIKINDIVLFNGFSCVVESLTDDSAVVRARGYSSRVWSVPVADLELHPLAIGRSGAPLGVFVP